MPVPQIFGAPNPQDTGGVFSALIGAQSRAADLQVQSAQNALGMIVSSVQAGLQARERRAAQLREIEAGNALEELRQSAMDRRQTEMIRAQRRMQRQSQRHSSMLAFRGMKQTQYNADRAFDADRSDTAFSQGMALRRDAREQDAHGVTLESAAQALAKGRREQKQLDLVEEQRGLFGRVFTELLRNNPDGTIDTSGIERLPQMLQMFQAQPNQVGPVSPGQSAAADPSTVPALAQMAQDYARQQESVVGPKLQRDISQQNADTARMEAEGRGGQGLGLASTLDANPALVAPAALDDLLKNTPNSASYSGELVAAANQGRLIFNPATGRLIGEGLDAGILAQVNEAIRRTPGQLEKFTQAVKLPAMSGQAGFDAVRASGILGGGQPAGQPQAVDTAQGGQVTEDIPADTGGGQSALNPRNAYLDALGVQRNEVQPPSSTDSDAGTPAPAAQPKAKGKGLIERFDEWRGYDPDKKHIGTRIRKSAGPSKLEPPAEKKPAAAVKPAPASKPAAELRKLVGRVSNPDPKHGDDPLHPENLRRKMQVLASIGDVRQARQIATLAAQMGLLSEAEMSRYVEQADAAARARPRSR